MREKLENPLGDGSHSGDDGVRLIEPLRQRRETESPAVSVVVVDSENGGPIERTLKTLFKQKFADFEVIVVRQGNVGFDSLVKRWPQIMVLHSEADLGFCRASNLATQTALGKYLLFLDNNAWLNPTALGKLVEAFEAEPGVGIAGPLILNANGTLQSIGMNINQFGRPLANVEPFAADVDILDNAFFVPGSVLMIEKQLFNSLSGFDELYVRGLEDADLCWRARLLGRKIVVNPWSIAYRQPGGGDVSNYLQHRNSLRMIIKNYGALKALTGGAKFVGSTIANSVISLLSLKPRVFYQYWRALFWNLAMLPDSMKQRRRVQRRRRLNDASVLEHVRADNEATRDLTKDRAA